MTRRRDDYESYLARCHRIEESGAALREARPRKPLARGEFERLLRRLHRLILLELEDGLSLDDSRTLDELSRRLLLDANASSTSAERSTATAEGLAEGTAEGAADGFPDLLEDALLDEGMHDEGMHFEDADFDDAEDDADGEAEVAAVDGSASTVESRPARRSRLGSLRPDARNRRALWQQARRGMRS